MRPVPARRARAGHVEQGAREVREHVRTRVGCATVASVDRGVTG
jgi:hypothetical protein